MKLVVVLMTMLFVVSCKNREESKLAANKDPAYLGCFEVSEKKVNNRAATPGSTARNVAADLRGISRMCVYQTRGGNEVAIDYGDSSKPSIAIPTGDETHSENFDDWYYLKASGRSLLINYLTFKDETIWKFVEEGTDISYIVKRKTGYDHEMLPDGPKEVIKGKDEHKGEFEVTLVPKKKGILIWVKNPGVTLTLTYDQARTQANKKCICEVYVFDIDPKAYVEIERFANFNEARFFNHEKAEQ